MSCYDIFGAKLLRSTALTNCGAPALVNVGAGMAAAAMLLLPSPAAAQDSGTPCVMEGQACNISSQGPDGPNGPNGGDDQPGSDGTPGGPGSDVTTDLEAARTLQSDGVVSPINISSIGGSGGSGGEGDNGDTGLANNNGGDGKPGGTGGNLTVTIGSALSGTAYVGPNGELVSGVTIQSIGGAGGAGGAASYEKGGQGNGSAGAGGDGQTIQANLGGSFTSTPGAGAAVRSVGGTGGGGKTDSYGKSPQSPDGGQGGDGGNVTVNVTGHYIGNDYGVYVISAGGDGGQGNGATDSITGYDGGTGGQAGKGGTVNVTLAAGATVEGTYANGASLYAASVGGIGGAGGKSHNGGPAGSGNDGGAVSVTVDGNVYTSGFGSTYGVLAQSLGGTGGGGGHASGWFNPIGGAGQSGGNGDTVVITGTGANVRLGSQQDAGEPNENSAGVVAQSIGGGGGVGPDSNGWFAVGGAGGSGSNGSNVNIELTDSTVTTFGFNSPAVIAQSIGGGGGKGGDACSSSDVLCQGAIVNMTVGGTAGSGGTAGDANAAMLGKSYIATINAHSNGIEIQSIGGGGGDGGSAYGKVDSLFYGAAISVGGNGGDGGNGGTVNVARTENNAGQVLTFDSNSIGIVGQSIGGGGGNGGASTAKASVKSENDDFPSQALAMAIGGSGGTGGSANAVYLQNSGLVATIGAGSVGMMAQSIGGGGGNGGDASATASASGSNSGISVSLALGGSGGVAGNGGNAEVMNHGLIVTTGGSAMGIEVQSIGGGGGNGGAGDAKSSTDTDVNQGEDDSENNPYGKSMSFSVGSAGDGGGAGTGASATATNTGAIITLGDGSHGIMAQSIGGGGGNGAGGAASTKGDIQFNLTIGGNGGNGGGTWSTGSVNVTNSGTITTFGADANGILAQSIGGGGGNGGKAGTSLSGGKSDQSGGNGTSSGVQGTLTDIQNNYAAKGVDAIGDYNTLANSLTAVNGLLGNNTLQAGLLGDDGDDLDDTAGSGGSDSDDNDAKSVSINVAVGGNGGEGGAAGNINVTNQAGASIATMGKASDAIIAQSIGGGGGKGGSASTASSGDISGSVALGGNGGKAGVNSNNGGNAIVVNDGSIYTIGAISSGIVAQSIGGGGGIAGSSSVSVSDSDGGGSGRKSAMNVTLGGLSETINGISETAQVTNSGAIETRGHDSYGIIAQSISGGGGIVKTLATDMDTDNSSTGNGGNSSSSKDFNINLQLGAAGNNVAGNAGGVFVTTNQAGAITTKGDDAIGILAQVVAGGGGLALGGKPKGNSAADFLGSGGKTGEVNGGLSTNPGDQQGVHVDVGANITTSGNGAVGVFAQSVGGSGGIAGDIGHTMQLANIGKAASSADYKGDGGDIAVTVEAGSSITTTGGNAPAIIAQSVGGGGGWITNNDYAYIGSAGGNGNGGSIQINVQGLVDAQGAASAGIFAQSTGGANNGGQGTGSDVTITIGDKNNPCTNTYGTCGAAVWGGNGFGAIAASVYVKDGIASALYNYGFINTHEQGNGYAIYSDNAQLQVLNYGIITGNTNLAVGGSFINEPGSTYVPLSTVNLGGAVASNAASADENGAAPKGTFINNGTVDIGGSMVRTVALTGNYGGVGKIVFDADFVNGTGDKLTVSGTANVAGEITVRPATMRNAKLALLTADGGLTLDPQIAATPSANQLFTYKFDSDGTALYATPQAQLAAQAQGLGAAKEAVAGHLQTMFDSGEAFDTGYTQLLNVADHSAYAKALDNLTGKALGGIAAYRYQASRRFVSDVNGACNAGDQATCSWARVQAGTTTQDDTTDTLGYRAQFAIYEMGAMTRIADGLYFGGAIAYERSKLRDGDRTARIRGDSVLGAIGLRYRSGPLDITGTVDGGYGWYSSNRTISVGGDGAIASAEPRLWNLGFNLATSYQMALGASSYLKPFAEIRGTRVHSNAFAEESKSVFALDVRSQGDFAVSGTIGAALGTSFNLGDHMVLKPFASAAVEFSDNTDWKTSATFIGDNTDPFTVRTKAPGTFGRFGVGADLVSGRNFDLIISYNPEIGSHYNTQQGVVRLTYRF